MGEGRAIEIAKGGVTHFSYILMVFIAVWKRKGAVSQTSIQLALVCSYPTFFHHGVARTDESLFDDKMQRTCVDVGAAVQFGDDALIEKRFKVNFEVTNFLIRETPKFVLFRGHARFQLYLDWFHVYPLPELGRVRRVKNVTERK